MLISRFLLNLRQAAESPYDTQDTFNSRLSVPGFHIVTLASVIGNMGEDLDHGPVEHVEDEAQDIGNDGAQEEDVMRTEITGIPCQTSMMLLLEEAII